MSNPTRIGQEAPDLKTPSSPSRITPTRALDDDAAEADPTEAAARHDRADLRSLVIRMLHAQFRPEDGFGRFDPVLSNSHSSRPEDRLRLTHYE